MHGILTPPPRGGGAGGAVRDGQESSYALSKTHAGMGCIYLIPCYSWLFILIGVVLEYILMFDWFAFRTEYGTRIYFSGYGRYTDHNFYVNLDRIPYTSRRNFLEQDPYRTECNSGTTIYRRGKPCALLTVQALPLLMEAAGVFSKKLEQAQLTIQLSTASSGLEWQGFYFFVFCWRGGA